MTKELTLSAREIARLIRSRTLSCSEIVEARLKQIATLNPALNALRFVNDAGARASAAKLQVEIDSELLRGRLHGVPFSAKDSVDIQGLPTSHGAVRGGTESAPQTSTFARRVLDQGAICVGKGNMAEYGKSYYTDNPRFGRSNNPFDPSRTPGGSSGGDAAAVAAGFAPFALASDSGGSVRVPANYCGIFGLYPTRGVLSDGDSASIPQAIAAMMRCNGILARHLEDIELLFQVLSGYDPLDPYSVPFPTPMVDRRFDPGKFLFFSRMNNASCDSRIRAQLEATVKKLESLGFRGEEVCPQELSSTFEIFIILAGQASLILEDAQAKDAGNPRDLNAEGHIMKNLRSRIANELPELTTENLLRAWAQVDRLRFSVQRVFQSARFVLAPVTATVAPLHGTSTYEIDAQKLPSQEVFQFASCVNVLGLPSIAFPTALSKERIPLGLQIIGPRFSEYALIDVLRKIGCTTGLRAPQLS